MLFGAPFDEAKRYSPHALTRKIWGLYEAARQKTPRRTYQKEIGCDPLVKVLSVSS
jgi:hypothetical protein